MKSLSRFKTFLDYHLSKPNQPSKSFLIYRKAAVKPCAFRPGISGERFADCLSNGTSKRSDWEFGRHEKKSQSAIFSV
jgi:hypothetical protein